eukprot:1046244-Heterocapsa_arctica.AAC.1
MTTCSMGKDCGNINSSTENNGAHAHCIRLDETGHNNRLDQSDNTITNRLNTSHHIDETPSKS